MNQLLNSKNYSFISCSEKPFPSRLAYWCRKSLPPPSFILLEFPVLCSHTDFPLARASCWNRLLSARLTSSIAEALFFTTNEEWSLSHAKDSLILFLFFESSAVTISCNHFHTNGQHLPPTHACFAVSSLSHATFLLVVQSATDKKYAPT